LATFSAGSVQGTLDGNSWNYGGAFFLQNPTGGVVVTDITLRNCYSGDNSGGIHVENAVFTVSGSTFTNLAGLNGGALALNKGTLTITSCTFTTIKGR